MLVGYTVRQPVRATSVFDFLSGAPIFRTSRTLLAVIAGSMLSACSAGEPDLNPIGHVRVSDEAWCWRRVASVCLRFGGMGD